jgi:hypothetical protein
MKEKQPDAEAIRKYVHDANQTALKQYAGILVRMQVRLIKIHRVTLLPM